MPTPSMRAAKRIESEVCKHAADVFEMAHIIDEEFAPLIQECLIAVAKMRMAAKSSPPAATELSAQAEALWTIVTEWAST